MPVPFNSIPAALRLPGIYVEFDNSLANNADPSFKILVIGQRLSAGTVAEGVPTRITSPAQAEEYFGRGSMLAEQLIALLAANQWMNITAIALDEAAAGAVATGTITITGTATSTGTLALYIAGKQVNVGVTVADTATVIGDAIAAAVAADTTLPVTAANVAGVVTFTAKWKGETGNGIDVRLGYYGEQLPKGIAAAIVAMSGGTTNPDLAVAIAAMADEWYNWIACPFTDAANLVKLETELDSRWGPTRQIGARAFTAFRGNHADTVTHGDSRNNPHVTCMGTNLAPQPPYIWAAVNTVVAAAALAIDPARPLQTLKLPNIMAPAIELRWTDAERNLLLFDGVASYKVGSDGSVMIERQITMYQVNAADIADDSYLDINVPETLERIRFEQRKMFSSKYPRHKLAEDDAKFGAGQAIMQPKLAKAELLALYAVLEFKGWVQDYAGYKTALVCEIGDGIGGGDRNRLNVQDSPKLVGQYRVHAQQTQFRK
jgi:phage tail sheath gpL-like